MSWAEIKKAINSDIELPLDKIQRQTRVMMNKAFTYEGNLNYDGAFVPLNISNGRGVLHELNITFGASGTQGQLNQKDRYEFRGCITITVDGKKFDDVVLITNTRQYASTVMGNGISYIVKDLELNSGSGAESYNSTLYSAAGFGSVSKKNYKTYPLDDTKSVTGNDLRYALAGKNTCVLVEGINDNVSSATRTVLKYNNSAVVQIVTKNGIHFNKSIEVKFHDCSYKVNDVASNTLPSGFIRLSHMKLLYSLY